MFNIQVKPLLPVAVQEEKMAAVEDEMKKVRENYERQKAEHDEMERRFAQIIEEKSILAEQLQAETEIAAEAEEVSISSLPYFFLQNISY